MTDLIRIDDIPAGRELDGYVAKYALRWRSVRGPTTDYGGPCVAEQVLLPFSTTEEQAFRMMPSRGVVKWYFFAGSWSTNPVDTNNLVHATRQLGLYVTRYTGPIGAPARALVQRFDRQEPTRVVEGEATAPTEALALCRALVKLGVGGDVLPEDAPR
jgi:hypothetical protein